MNKDDSREGIRAYARGRSYIPGRYGGVTPYTDPNEIFRAQAQAAGKKKGRSTETKEEEQPKAVQAPEAVSVRPPMAEEPPAGTMCQWRSSNGRSPGSWALAATPPRSG